MSEVQRPDDGFYEALIDTSPMVVFRTSGDGVDVRYVSPNVERIFGWAPDVVAAPGWSWLDIVHPDDVEGAIVAFARFFEDTSEPLTSLLRIARADGEHRWAWARFREDPAEPGDLCGFLLDADDRVKADLEANRQRDLFMAVLDHATVTVRVTDLEGRFLVANRQVEEVLGVGPGELLGKTLGEVRPGAQADSVSANDAAVLAAGAPIQVEEVVEGAAGVRTYASTRFPLVDAAGKAYAVGGISTDITERTEAESRLRRSEVFLDSIIDNIPNMVFVKDAKDLRFVRFNRAGEELLGRSRDELLGKSDHDLFPQEQADAFVRADREVLERGTLLDIPEEEIDTLEHGRRILHTKKIPVYDEDGEAAYLLGISDDITERRSADEALRAAKDEAERANHAKSEFLSRMSHELRTPLNSILGFAQLLELDDLEEHQVEAVGQIHKGGRHLLDLINEILDISRIEAGTMTLSLEPVAIDSMIQECLDLVRPQALARSIELVNLDSRRRHVRADRQRLKQVLLNLLSNAVKFNRDGGTISVSCDHGPQEVRVSVADTGPGIRPELLDRLFTPFDRLEADSAGIQGTGLGLALSLRLVESMGGAFDVKSTPGEGSTFSFVLPVGASEEAADEQRRLPVEPRPETTATATVLYIEDNLANLRLVEQVLLRRPGIRLVSAQQASIGLELATQHQPDLILLDVHLPDLSGAVVLQRLKADVATATIPVVMVSADATERQVRRFEQLGADEYVTKPLDIARLLEIVDARLGIDPDGERPAG